ncbi:MAG: heparin lyase I family protein [Actinobacteria bacterium]|nr:heparin lyase I family protein [Actinomycetota bacterium]
MQALQARVTLLSTDPFRGQNAARFEVREGDVEPDTGSSRAEVTGPTFDEGQDIYVRDAIRIPAGNTFSAPWQLIDQLHEKPWTGSPGIAVFLDAERRISISNGTGSPFYWQGPRLELERWYELIYRDNLSQDPTQGFVEVWLNGHPQTLTNGATRMYGRTIETPETYLKAGIYRSKFSTGTSIVEHADLGVGPTLASVLGR